MASELWRNARANKLFQANELCPCLQGAWKFAARSLRGLYQTFNPARKFAEELATNFQPCLQVWRKLSSKLSNFLYINAAANFEENLQSTLKLWCLSKKDKYTKIIFDICAFSMQSMAIFPGRKYFDIVTVTWQYFIHIACGVYPQVYSL